MRSFGIWLGLLGAVVAGGAACGTTDEDAESGDNAATADQIGAAFDVNDVSILFPLKDGAPYPSLTVGNRGVGETQTPAGEPEFLATDAFKQVIAEARSAQIDFNSSPDQDFFVNRELWRIVGLRFDPCAPGFSQAARDTGLGAGKCIIQFRLIAQPFRPGQKQAEDFTMHLVFNLGTEDLAALPKNPVIQAATQMLAGIKDASLAGGVKTSGQPLGVHPGLAAEAKGSGKTVGDAVKAMMKKLTATPSRNLAFMGLRNGGPEPWTFFFGAIDNGKFVRAPQMPATGAKQQTLSFIGGGPVVEKSQLPVNTSPLFGSSLSADQKQLAFKVENASTQFFQNTDCVSCHTSSGRTHALRLGDGPEISARAHVTKNITGYVDKAQSQDSNWNIRNFGYFFTKPTVSGRTVAETVDVVQFLNTKVRNAGGLNGPGPDCTAVDDTVWKCFRDGKGDCLKTCAAPPKPDQIGVAASGVADPLVLDPQAPNASKDPCFNPSVGGEPTVLATFPTKGGTQVNAELGGNDSQCLSRFFGGSFVGSGGDVTVGCTSPAFCSIQLSVKPGEEHVATVALRGADAGRFKKFFRVGDKRFFQTRAATGGAVRLKCEGEECIISIGSGSADLPADALPASSRVNP